MIGREHRRVWRRLFVGAAMLGVTAAFTFSALMPGVSLANEAKPAENGGGAEGVPEVGPYFRNLPDLLVNLKSSTNRPVFLKISLSVEAPTPEDRAAVDHAMPFILDALQVYLRELTPEDMRGSSAMYRLRGDLLRRISLAINPARVSDVLFKEMLVQ